MGDYSQRNKELTTLIAELPENDRGHFTPRVSEYLEARRRRLDELVEAIPDVCLANDDPERRWKRALESLADDHARTLGQLLSGINDPSTAALALKWKIQSEEDRFIRSLLDLGIPARWGKLGGLLRELEAMDRSLRARWAGLMEKKKSIDDAQGTAARHLKEILTARKSEGDSRQSKVAEQLKTYAAELARLKEGSANAGWHDAVTRGVESIFANLDRTLEEVSADARAWTNVNAEARRDLAQLRMLQEAELGNIHRLFYEARKEAEDFKNASRLDRAKTLQREGQDLLGSWSSSQSGSALQSDAAALAKDLSAKTEALMSQLSQAWDAFIREHEGRFFGSFSSATLEAMLNTSAWSSRQGWYNDLARAFSDLRTAGGGLDETQLRTAAQELTVAAQARLAEHERRYTTAQEYRRTLESRHERSRAELRTYLFIDSDLDAFIIDHFSGAVPSNIDLPSDLTRSDKMNLLFEASGAEKVLQLARTLFEQRYPFDKNDKPNKRYPYPVNDTEREVLLELFKTDPDLDAFALDVCRRAYDEFTSSMTRRQKAALLFANYGPITLDKAREYYIFMNPFDEQDMPRKKYSYSVSASDREALVAILKTDAEMDGFAIDSARQAYNEFKSMMGLRRKAALILAMYGSDALRYAKDYYCRVHPFDDQDRPTKPGGYPVEPRDRDKILAALITDSDITAFALDYLPRAQRDFTSSMTTTQKISLMLWHYGASTVFSELEKHLGAGRR